MTRKQLLRIRRMLEEICVIIDKELEIKERENITLKTDEDIINEFLVKIQMPSNLNGYTYIQIGLKLCIGNNLLVNSLTNGLYPAIAKELDMNSIAPIKKGVYNAIEVTFLRGNKKYLNTIFSKKPSSKAFFKTVVDLIKLEIE